MPRQRTYPAPLAMDPPAVQRERDELAFRIASEDFTRAYWLSRTRLMDVALNGRRSCKPGRTRRDGKGNPLRPR